MRNSLVTLATIGLLLPACTMVRSDVTRFDQLPSSIACATVVFLPLDDQKASAAYQSYTNRVAAELAKHGIDKVDDIGQADYAVVVAYGVGAERQMSGVLPLYGQTGGGTTFHSGSVSTYGAGGRTYGAFNGMSSSVPPMEFSA